MKSAMKIESVAEFLARGGKITKVAPNVGKRVYAKKAAQETAESEIDFGALPEELRLKYSKKA